jgi:hypothetical protein
VYPPTTVLQQWQKQQQRSFDRKAGYSGLKGNHSSKPFIPTSEQAGEVLSSTHTPHQHL